MNRLYYIPNKQFLEELLIHLHETGYKWKGQFPLTSYIMFYLIWPSRNGDLGIYIDEHSKLVSHCNFNKIAKQEKGKIRVIQNKSIKQIKRMDKLNVYERIDKLHKWFNQSNKEKE